MGGRRAGETTKTLSCTCLSRWALPARWFASGRCHGGTTAAAAAAGRRQSRYTRTWSPSLSHHISGLPSYRVSSFIARLRGENAFAAHYLWQYRIRRGVWMKRRAAGTSHHHTQRMKRRVTAPLAAARVTISVSFGSSVSAGVLSAGHLADDGRRWRITLAGRRVRAWATGGRNRRASRRGTGKRTDVADGTGSA